MEVSKPPTENETLVRGRLSCLALLIIVVGIIGYIFSARMYVSSVAPSIDANSLLVSDEKQPGPPARITMARGEMVTLILNLGKSANMDWASSTGLQLVLNGLAPIQFVAPIRPYWGKTFTWTFSSDPQDFLIKGSLLLPASIGGPEQRLLSGEIQGNFITPSIEGDTSQDIHLPIQIQLMPSRSFDWSSGRNPFYLFAGIVLLFLVGMTLFLIWNRLHRWLRGRQTPRAQAPLPTKKSTFGNFFDHSFQFLGFLGLCTLVLFLGIGIGTPLSVTPVPEIIISVEMILALIALSLLVSWKEWMYAFDKPRKRK